MMWKESKDYEEREVRSENCIEGEMLLVAKGWKKRPLNLEGRGGGKGREGCGRRSSCETVFLVESY